MAHDLLNFFNLDADENIEESLRLALMFKKEVDEATNAYLEMLELSIDPESTDPEEMARAIREAINAALVTGIRAYRSWIHSQGVDVWSVEAASGKDIPPVAFHPNARWPM